MDARRNSTPTMVEEDMEAMGWEIYPSLPELVASGEYSDFNIRCDGQLYPLHQAIVCPQSRAMRAACSVMQGAAPRTMHIEETDTFTIRYAINFLYEEDYEIDPDWVEDQVRSEGAQGSVDAANNEKAVKTLLAHIRVSLFAHHHGIEGLSEYSASQIKHLFSSVPAHRLPAFIQRMDSCTRDIPRQWVTASNIRVRIQERVRDVLMAPDFYRLNVDRRILLEIIRACGGQIRLPEPL
ncbi:hypothetical protein DER45DRAFT_543380 [Fusarium avenaceum]|nr:hypothetical protein DER45DRAFT_543380 [Fusarium avenaceum]